jgi:hypothetical protein
MGSARGSMAACSGRMAAAAAVRRTRLPWVLCVCVTASCPSHLCPAGPEVSDGLLVTRAVLNGHHSPAIVVHGRWRHISPLGALRVGHPRFTAAAAAAAGSRHARRGRRRRRCGRLRQELAQACAPARRCASWRVEQLVTCGCGAGLQTSTCGSHPRAASGTQRWSQSGAPLNQALPQGSCPGANAHSARGPQTAPRTRPWPETLPAHAAGPTHTPARLRVQGHGVRACVCVCV